MDLLPDSRLKTLHTPRGMTNGPGGTWIPYFCANCGKHCGWCPETSTFFFYICPPCFETHGEIAGLMMVPDKVFFDRVAQEQQAAYGRVLSHEELLRVVQEDSSPLAKLLKEAK